MSTFSDFHVWEHELIPLYLRVGAGQFCRRDVADIIPAQAATRYAHRGYFVQVRDAAGRKLRIAQDRRVWQLHPKVVSLCKRTIEHDHRWENLAAGLTGGSECA